MKREIKRSLLAVSIGSALVAPATVLATNGMNMEGYGPIATGMGGASMAYDNGSAAVMNNPATLGLMDDGASRLDVAVGNLGPDITSSMTGMPDAASSADSFYMPAAGWVAKTGQWSYGVGMFAQGGMGTEYAANSFLTANPYGVSGADDIVRSEVGFGRLIAPIVYQVDDNLSVGGSIDYVWAGMDLKMAMSGGQFVDFVSTQNTGAADGQATAIFGGAFTANNTIAPTVDPLTGCATGTFELCNVRFDFSNDSDYTGEATGNGFGYKLGLTYKINKDLTFGATYHAKTDISDLESSDAQLGMTVDQGTGRQFLSMEGDITVTDFQWPATFALGINYQQDQWMVAADLKVIQWSDVMDSFRMTFTPDSTDPVATAFGINGQDMNVEMFQNWDDQTVIQVGGAYKVTPETTLRAGINSSSNPIPDQYVNPLFPATIENHLTLGVGYAISKVNGVDFSLTVAPEVEVTGTNSNVTTAHSQLSWQLMYSHNF